MFSHLSNNITSFRTIISRWGKYSWIFSFSQLRTGPFEESGALRRVKIHLSVKLWKCLSHCSSIRNKITTFPNQISKSSFSSWCWMTFTAVTVLVGRVLYWLHGPVLMHSNCSVIFPIAKVIIITIQDRKCVKNVFPLATFPRVYSFAPRLDRSNVIITVSAYRGAGPRALTTNSCTKFQLNIFPERDSA